MDVALAGKGGIERYKSWMGALETLRFTKVHQVPHQDFSSLETHLTLLEQESARSRAVVGNAIAYHDLGFKSKI